jgi:hypothetical protein
MKKGKFWAQARIAENGWHSLLSGWELSVNAF